MYTTFDIFKCTKIQFVFLYTPIVYSITVGTNLYKNYTLQELHFLLFIYFVMDVFGQAL